MNLNFEAFFQTLPMMGWGMLGIFAVMVAIGLLIVILNRVTAAKDEEKDG